MSTEFLKDVQSLSSKEEVVHLISDLEEDVSEESPQSLEHPDFGNVVAPNIVIDHTLNTIIFKIQNGPIKEKGKNGCQIDDLIEVALEFIKTANSRYACRENALAITKLEEALMWLEQRKKNREKRGVEGLSQQ
jgi:hypothetical protein